MRYSTGCDASRKPLGHPTLHIPRPKIGNVSYDGFNGISQCARPGTVALTFDDGPFNYTSHILGTSKCAVIASVLSSN